MGTSNDLEATVKDGFPWVQQHNQRSSFHQSFWSDVCRLRLLYFRRCQPLRDLKRLEILNRFRNVDMQQRCWFRQLCDLDHWFHGSGESGAAARLIPRRQTISNDLKPLSPAILKDNVHFTHCHMYDVLIQVALYTFYSVCADFWYDNNMII